MASIRSEPAKPPAIWGMPVNKYYDEPPSIDNVVVTHPDKDHAEGVQAILKHFGVGALWMLRPWNYVDELIDRFAPTRTPRA